MRFLPPLLALLLLSMPVQAADSYKTKLNPFTNKPDYVNDLSFLSLSSLSDISINSPSANQVLTFNGTKWVNGSANNSLHLNGDNFTVSGNASYNTTTHDFNVPATDLSGYFHLATPSQTVTQVPTFSKNIFVTNDANTETFVTVKAKDGKDANIDLQSATTLMGMPAYVSWRTRFHASAIDNATYELYSPTFGRTFLSIGYSGTTTTYAFPQLTTNGFVKTSSSDGTLTVDTSTYLTDAISDNQTYGRKNGAWEVVTTTETDPIFGASAAHGISVNDVANWNTAYGWGNHASAGYETTSHASSTYQPIGSYLTSVKHTIGITVDGAGSPITTGTKGYFRCPYAGTISSVTLIADQSGSCVIDVWKHTTIPTVTNTITASAKPTLASQQTTVDSTLTGWTKTVSAGDYFGYNVDSASTVTRVSLILEVTS